MTTPPLTDDERQLLAAAHRWARSEGWHRCNGYLTNRKDTVRLDWQEYYDGTWTRLVITNPSKTGPAWVANIGEVQVTSVRQAVDVLVALNILPGRFTNMPPHEGVW